MSGNSNEYNPKSCSVLEKSYYSPIEAAIRWCGLVEHEATICSVYNGSQMPGLAQFPQWPCLKANVEKLFDAIQQREISYGRDGREVSPGEHVAPARVTVRHVALKEWLSKYYPDQKPDFLFDEIERSIHTAFNADSFRALQADIQATKADLSREMERSKKIAKERDALRGERDSLAAMVEHQAELSPSERKSLIKMVFGMAVDGYGYEPADKKVRYHLKSLMPQQELAYRSVLTLCENG